MDRLPIIYIRGYAGSTSGIDAQVDDPFYGFNKGATHVRVGRDYDPTFYQFEGPMLRLMIDHDYKLLVHGDQWAYLNNRDANTVPANSIWVYRFYDKAATTYAAEPDRNLIEKAGAEVQRHLTAKGFDIKDAARGLLKLIDLVGEKVKGDDKRVILVAHSMGGLVARCMIQKIAFDAGRKPQQLVAKLFTYGTPHGGIVFGSGLANWFQEVIGPAGSDIFSPQNMIEYLHHPDHEYGDNAKKEDEWDPQSIPVNAFDPDNIFCFIGTDSKDYGLSKMVVGPKSDGLVRIGNAYVRNAHRAYAYKSHSGSYGEVNSEEGYQNLRRFLFGRWKVRVDLANLPPNAVGQAPNGDSVIWQLETRLAVRGLSVVLSEQLTEQQNPIQLNDELHKLRDSPEHPVPLVTTFLLDFTTPLQDPPTKEEEIVVKHHGICRYSLVTRVIKLQERHGVLDFSEHIEQVFDWADAAIFDVGPDASGEGLHAWAKWNSDIHSALEDYDPRQERPRDVTLLAQGLWQFELPFPESARALGILGSDCKLRVTITDRATASPAQRS